MQRLFSFFSSKSSKSNNSNINSFNSFFFRYKHLLLSDRSRRDSFLNLFSLFSLRLKKKAFSPAEYPFSVLSKNYNSFTSYHLHSKLHFLTM